MSDKPLYDMGKLVDTIDDWAKRHRIKRDAANEVGAALGKVCSRYEAELTTLRSQLAECQEAGWEDVPDDLYPLENDETIVIGKGGRSVVAGHVDCGHAEYGEVTLPDNWRIQRKKGAGNE